MNPDPDTGPTDLISDTDADVEFEIGAVAQLMSDLSQPSPMPKGVMPADEPSAFDADNLDFATNEWLLNLQEVQAWLCLDSPLPDGASSEVLVAMLFGQISPDRAEACFTVDPGGRVILTHLGLQHLETRLSRAVEHKAAFLDMLDDDRSSADASAEWRQLWEDADSQPRQPVAIDASVKTWTIKTFREYAEERLLDLNPSYQRDVVWSNSESQVLIESILRGIPLPSVILSQVAGEDRWQIVDGKQRLTAILRFMGHHPEGRAHAEGLEGGLALFDTNFRKFARDNQLKPRDVSERFLPFKLRKYPPSDPLHAVSGKYYCEVRDASIRIGEDEAKVKQIFESAASRYLIPVILYQKTRLRDIHDVFGLYNKQGKKLNAEELRNAAYHHLELTRLLLVLSGDRPDPELLAKYLPTDVRERLDEVGEVLTARGFGTTRFKRTKVLAWMTAILLRPPRELANGVLSTPSTANHINSLLDDVSEKEQGHRLYHRPTLVALARDLQGAILLHSDADAAWHPQFRTKKNQQGMASKWEELPLVASLIACFILVATDNATVLRDNRDKLRELTLGWRGPQSTQNKTQWRHIAQVATRVVDALGLHDEELSRRLMERYAYSCLPALRRLAEQA